ncbi:MAG: 50S ribosomal protein L11 methyltransferase [Proteobacteria bacterium]|nr:50S ribosomal protein L11 methyltransferase [Pseudomonadota bacterium]
MAWVELQIPRLPYELVELVTVRLVSLGAAGTQEDDLPGTSRPPRQPWDTGPLPPPPNHVLLRVWFEDPDPPRIQASLVDLLPAPLLTQLQWELVPEVDWQESWKIGFKQIHISDRLVVAPPWDATVGALIIEPGQAFGTGAHPSTIAVLRAIDDLADQVHSLLDIGCGSGILALAGAKLGLRSRGIDIDEPSVAEAKRNAKVNQLTAEFSDATIAGLTTGADLVACNLFAEAIADLAPELVRLTGQWLVLAGLLVEREHLVTAVVDLPLVQRDEDGPWVCLRYRR